MSQEAQIVVGSPNGLPTDLPKVNPTLHQCRHAEAAPAPAAVPQYRIWADGVAIDTLSRPHNHNASLVKKYFSERMGLQMKLFLDTKETGINSSMQETNSTICKIFESRCKSQIIFQSISSNQSKEKTPYHVPQLMIICPHNCDGCKRIGNSWGDRT